jgi:hypothetical protein
MRKIDEVLVLIENKLGKYYSLGLEKEIEEEIVKDWQEIYKKLRE